MSTDTNQIVNQVSPIHRADGATIAEKYLKRLCERIFLSLWSYSGIYRDQGRHGKTGDGKEVCDLLVVFENHIIIFSDKHCEFPNTGNLELDWGRWFRRAIYKSAEQIWGAEKWIKTYPDRLFLDRACTQKFPLNLPDPSKAKIHRIVVAHGVSKRCREELGGSGSLMILPQSIGSMHDAITNGGVQPFTVGQIDTTKGFVHVLDDTSLDIVMNTVDTITDFVSYLSKKEEFICSDRFGGAAGEEDLLAYYLKNLNKAGDHDFVIPDNVDIICIDEGHWEKFVRSPQRQAQILANEVSYMWDEFIERFNKHILADTQYYRSHLGVANQERIIRFLAREPRTRRRMLARSLLELMRKKPKSQKIVRVMGHSHACDPLYVFLLLPHIESVEYSEYREVRGKLLEDYCKVTKLKFPEAQDIVGIATEPGVGINRSEDAIYFDARSWTANDQAEAQSLQKDLGLLREITFFTSKEMEYPELIPSPYRTSVPMTQRQRGNQRNKTCPCGSGKKYKRCCGH